MGSVVVIEESNHGRIAIAQNYTSAVNFLIEAKWLYERTATLEGKTVIAQLGENWKEVILKWNSIAHFNVFFEDVFFLESVPVYY